jgi:lipooligosaccharide transport system permease protein
MSGAMRVLERNAVAYRRMWLIFASGLLEPVLFLLSIGIGVGALVGKLPGPAGEPVAYRDFVAPGLLAVSAMNAAVFDTTFMFFIKLKYWGIFDSMLATPLTPRDIASGEIAWSVLRGTIYAGFFLLTMLCFGVLRSPWAVLALPVAVLTGWAFAAIGADGASFMRSYFDFDFVNLVLIPSFLFSGIFFPLDRYPDWLAWIVRLTPLYQSVALARACTFGAIHADAALHVAYLLAMGLLGNRIAGRRLGTLLTP